MEMTIEAKAFWGLFEQSQVAIGADREALKERVGDAWEAMFIANKGLYKCDFHGDDKICGACRMKK